MVARKACKMRGKTDECLELLDRALEQNPGNFRVIFEKAQIMANAGRYEEARAMLIQIEAMIPKEPAVAVLRAQLEQAMGNMKEAVYWYAGAATHGFAIKENMTRLLLDYIKANPAENAQFTIVH